MKITFLGANRQVTGSRYCLEAGGRKILIDCGMFQEREFQARNWDACPEPPNDLDALLLTHVHIDHCGLIPKIVREGFRGPIYATPPSVDLVPIMLHDAARIQMEDAKYKKKRHEREKRRGPHPEIPLYTDRDVDHALPLFEPVEYGEPFWIGDEFCVTYHDAGHIIGSASIEIVAREGNADTRIVFSGDIGQWDRPLLNNPSLISQADYVVMESTYGDREHLDNGNVEDLLAEIVNRTVERGGNVVVPVFAVDRAQQMMYHIGRLVHDDRIPDIPIFLDSPMALDVTQVYRQHSIYMDEATRAAIASPEPPLHFPGLRMVRSVSDSKEINELGRPAFIMSTAGMCNAGRIKHHLRQNIERPECTILFSGYQAQGTLGRQIIEGSKHVRIHGRDHKVLAEIAQIQGLSAHADRSELLRWLRGFQEPPKRVFLVHGEESASESLAEVLRREFASEVEVPEYGSVAELD
jgi:metallo-beta-lactamase family protein